MVFSVGGRFNCHSSARLGLGFVGMRVHGEVSDDEAAAVGESVPLSPPPASAVQQRLVVGYALTKKKVRSFLQPKLLALAR